MKVYLVIDDSRGCIRYLTYKSLTKAKKVVKELVEEYGKGFEWNKEKTVFIDDYREIFISIQEMRVL